MTKFERVGSELQFDSGSLYEANRNFKYSCRLCCNRGFQIECDRCAIRHAHDIAVSVFEDIEAERECKCAEERRKAGMVYLFV